MPSQKCAKPAAVFDSKLASHVELLGGGLDSKHSVTYARTQAASRRLIGERYSAAVPDTTMSHAFLAAVRRKVGAR